MQIDLSRLFEQDGSHLELNVPLEKDTVSFGGQTYAITDKSDIDLRVVHKTKRQFEISGHAKLSLCMKCSRCLEDVTVPFDLELDSSFDMDASLELDELPYVVGYSLDVDLLVFDELFINMPISILCDDNCKGLCTKCGINLNHGSCDCDTTVLDPRMAKILDIYNAHNKEV